MTRRDNLDRPLPMFSLALPSPAIQIKPRFIRWPIFAAITLTPAKFLGVMLRATESPHIVERPDNRLFDTAYVRDRKHLTSYPVQMHDIGVTLIDALDHCDGKIAGE